MNGYRGKHRRHATPGELPVILRGLADLIEVISDEEEQR